MTEMWIMVNVSGVMSIVLGKKTTMKITIFNSYSLKINIRKHKLFYVIQFGGGGNLLTLTLSTIT